MVDVNVGNIQEGIGFEFDSVQNLTFIPRCGVIIVDVGGRMIIAVTHRSEGTILR